MIGSGRRDDTVTYTAGLTGSSQVPATGSKGTGTVTATYDAVFWKLTYTATYSGLSGPVTAARFHGLAAAANAPPIVPVPATALADPIKGDATLTDAQAAATSSPAAHTRRVRPSRSSGSTGGVWR
ncbi:MAG: CHRD domain-containing protein [Acetobacteraceae bacterium]|nr:CHRD domain-containing protein [Acetobacteraceae bacterium]